jgi:hypothetical protein
VTAEVALWLNTVLNTDLSHDCRYWRAVTSSSRSSRTSLYTPYITFYLWCS